MGAALILRRPMIVAVLLFIGALALTVVVTWVAMS
jgi:hypothetical protein